MDSVLSDILATCLPGVVLVALSLVAAEIGYRIGRRLKAGADDAMRSEIYTLQSAMLALLALLLGFSFAMGASAYENRLRVILDETLVIAKAHKRADLLPEPTRSEVRERLIHYIDTRLDLFYQGAAGEHGGTCKAARIAAPTVRDLGASGGGREARTAVGTGWARDRSAERHG